MTLLKNLFIFKVFSFLCPHGAMAANSGLSKQLHTPPALVCYGVTSDKMLPTQDWHSARLRVLFSGSLLEEVGSGLLLNALRSLRHQYPDISDKLHVVVTGKGPCAAEFRAFSEQAPDLLSFQGSLKRVDYLRVLRGSHVGLSLRLSDCEMGKTTFPSKVVEYAEHGLLVVTTRVSDVSILFRDAAVYLDLESEDCLGSLLVRLAESREYVRSTAVLGRKRVIDVCGSEVVGRSLHLMLT